VVIFSWAVQLCRDTGWELLDGHAKTIDWERLRTLIETEGTKILDFHIWRIAPKAVAAELVVSSGHPRGSEHYRRILRDNFSVQHSVIEERTDKRE
jgi:Co/Zn/Cd efflux system component